MSLNEDNDLNRTILGDFLAECQDTGINIVLSYISLDRRYSPRGRF